MSGLGGSGPLKRTHDDVPPDAAGAYDLLLHDTIVASVFRNGSRQPYTWTAELLEYLPRSKRPAPFQEIVHDFTSLDELCA